MELIGWAGAGLLLSAFFYLTIFKKKGDNSFYLFGNLFGSIGLLINAWHNDALPFVLVNAFWVVITLISLVKKFMGERSTEG